MEHFLFETLRDVVKSFPEQFLSMDEYPDHLVSLAVAGVSHS